MADTKPLLRSLADRQARAERASDRLGAAYSARLDELLRNPDEREIELVALCADVLEIDDDAASVAAMIDLDDVRDTPDDERTARWQGALSLCWTACTYQALLESGLADEVLSGVEGDKAITIARRMGGAALSQAAREGVTKAELAEAHGRAGA